MELNKIFSIIFTYKKAPIAYREKIAIPFEELGNVLRKFKEKDFIEEIFILSTCNRTEFYFVSCEREKCINFLREFIELKIKDKMDYFDLLMGEEAIVHILEVSSGIDSMILGEPQILGQVKDAYNVSLEEKSVGIVLNQILQKAIRCGKRVRSETEIGFGAVSVSFAVVELAKKVFGKFSGKSATVIGLGEMGKLCANHLIENGIEKLYVCNRTYEKAINFSKKFEIVEAVAFDYMWDAISNSQIIISSTSSDGYILKFDDFQKKYRKKYSEIFIADIAIPRDIDPEIGKEDYIFLFDIDDLKGVIQKNIEKRKREAKKAGEIIFQEVGKLVSWIKGLEIKDVIVSLRKKILSIKDDELKKYHFATERERDMAEKIAHSITNKFLHFPLSFLKKVPYEDAPFYSEILKNIFKLEEDIEKENSCGDKGK